MKHFLIAAALILAPSLALSQDVSSGSEANSVSAVQATTQSGVYSYNEATTIPTRTTLDNVPAVSAPAIFGGGHPCLAGGSGSVAFAGFGGSYGRGVAETVCMLYIMGQPEAAIRALVMNDRQACAAINNVGYYRVGDSVIPFRCGEQVVKGGKYTDGVSKKVVTGSKGRPTLFTKCYRKANNQIVIKYTSAGKANQKIAQNDCIKSLG